MRSATIKRKTKETDIEVSVNLDGTGVSNVATGIGFFDHMLDLLARHSRIDITVKAVGDLHIDHHHTTEDVGIALGQAVKQALGTMAGVNRCLYPHADGRDAVARGDRHFGASGAGVQGGVSARQGRHIRYRTGSRMVQRIRDQCRRDFARREPIWREQPSYRRTLPQWSGEGPSCGGRDRSACRGRGAIHQGSARRLIACFRRRGAMPIYTVHAPTADTAGIAATDRFAFVRDGFHFWAALLGPLWLAWHRLWLALIGWIVVMIAIEVAMARLGASGTAMFFTNVLIALLMGFEAASIRRWTLSRRNWRQLDIVVADDEESAERRFFDRWTAKQRVLNDQSAVDRGAPPPTRDIPGQPFSRPPPLPQSEIIGLFPEPGASR